MILFIVIVLSTFGGFCIGRAYERAQLADMLLDLAARHREDVERIPR